MTPASKCFLTSAGDVAIANLPPEVSTAVESHARIVHEGEERGHSVEVIDTTRCYMAINAMAPEVHYDGKRLPRYDAVIPLDQVIAAMDEVGRSLPAELRCTALGGLSMTPTSRATYLDNSNRSYLGNGS